MDRNESYVVPVVAAMAAVTAGVAYLASREDMRHRRQRRKGSKVTVIGDMFCDVVANGIDELPKWGTDCPIRNPVRLVSGGSGLNTAIWLHNLSHDIQVTSPQTFSRRNGDPFTDTVQAAANKAGLTVVPPRPLGVCSAFADQDDILTCEIDNDRLEWATGTCVCLSGPHDRSFVTFRGGNESFKLTDFPLNRLVPPGTRHVHIGGYYNCPGIWGSEVGDFIRLARKGGVKTVSLNPQYGKGWGGDIDKVIPLVDFFVCNEVEAKGITNEDDLLDAARVLGTKFECNCVVVTMGAEGALLFRRCLDLRPIRVLCKDFLETPLTDTIGVGDAFCAGFLHEVITRNLTAESPELIDAVRYGCACGTAACTVTGGSSFPGLNTIRECLID